MRVAAVCTDSSLTEEDDMNCFRWDMTCIAPPHQDVSCETPVWFWLLAAVGAALVVGKK